MASLTVASRAALRLGCVIAEVTLRDPEDNTLTYHSQAEVTDVPVLYHTSESTFDRQVAEDDNDKALWSLIEESTIATYDDYDAFYEAMDSAPDDDTTALICEYLAYMVRADWDKVEQMKHLSIGKALVDFEIPTPDNEDE